jgi:MFS family permease
VLGWRNVIVWIALTAGLALLGVFCFVERSPNAMVPLGLFESRTFLGANLLTLFLYAALGEFFFIVPLQLIQVQHYSPAGAGAAVLPIIGLTFLLARWSGGLVDRYGARGPLIIGPVLCGVGFVLCALLASGQHYWTSLFPAMVILGLGLAVTVAPLTTTVMGAVDPKLPGTASGINNAVARVAGLLSIAILGIVLVGAFNWRLDEQLKSLHLTPDVRQQVWQNRSKLAGMEIPKTDAATVREITGAVYASFLTGFRLVLGTLAALALASAGVAWRMIGEAKAQHGAR